DDWGAVLGVHADALDVQYTWPAIGKYGSGNVSRLPLSRHRDGDQAFIVFRHFARNLLNHDATLLGNNRCGHDIHVAKHRTQEAGKRRRGERLGIHLSNCALVSELDLTDPGFGQLPCERAELFGQCYEWLKLWRFLGADRGKINGVTDRSPQQIVRHLLSDLKRNVFLRFTG